MGFKFSPGGCCCDDEEDPCAIAALDFSGGAVTDNFTITAGSWAISGGKLNATSSNAILTALTTNPNGNAYSKVSADITITTSGDTARIYLATTSWSVEVKFGTGSYIRILNGGSEVSRCTTSISTGAHTVCASIRNDDGVVTIRGNVRISTGPDVWRTASAAAGGASGSGWGLGTGTRTGTVSFDNVVASVTECGDCTTGDCPDNCCTGDLTGTEWIIDLGAGGWTNDLVGYCDQVAGEYTLTWGSPYLETNVDPYDCPLGECAPNYRLVISISLFSCKFSVSVTLRPDGGCSDSPEPCSATAEYESDEDIEDCLGGPFTLTKTFDSPAIPCAGSMPSTITMTRAA
jgi:hypothetical protein